MMLIRRIIVLILVLMFSVSCDVDDKNLSDKQSKSFPPVTLSATEREQAEALFKHIPHDTPYLIVHIKPLPKDALNFHLDNYRKMIRLIAESFGNQAPVQYKLASESESSQNHQSLKKDQKTTNKDNDNFNVFFNYLLDEVADNLSIDKLENLGFTKGSVGAFYAYKNNPIFRQKLADRKSLLNLIHKSAQASQYKIEWKKCNQYDCLINNTESRKKQMAAILLDDQLVIASFTPESFEEMITHLTNKNMPEKHYDLESWLSFLGENQFKGYGDGIVKTSHLFNSINNMIAKRINYSNKEQQKEVLKQCEPIIKNHIKLLPEIYLGIKRIEEKEIQTEIVVKTNKHITQLAKQLANPKTSLQQTKYGMVEIGINTDLNHLRKAFARYVNYLNQDESCPLIPRATISNWQNYLLGTYLTLGNNQLKHLYMVADHLEFLPDSPINQKIDGYISINSNDPAELYKSLMRRQPVTDEEKDITGLSGEKVQIKSSQLSGLPLDQLAIAAHKDNIELFLGDYEPEFVPFTPDRPLIFWIKVNNERYVQHLRQIEKDKSKLASKESKKHQIATDNPTRQMINESGNYKHTTLHSISADNRGLIINYDIRYH